MRPIDPGGAGTLGDHAEGARDLHRAREAGGEKQTMARRAAGSSGADGGDDYDDLRQCQKVDNSKASK